MDNRKRITKECGTEPPFNNEYWNNKEPGIYVDVDSGDPLFLSTAKFDSGTGWPSFTAPILSQNIQTRVDTAHGMIRTEVRSKKSDNHLGHVFRDGPNEWGEDGLRYCINSASLRFISEKAMAKEGYAEWLPFLRAKEIVLAGGCFWGMEELLRKQKGVLQTLVGYIGGKANEGHYEQVKTGRTKHAEAVLVRFDPETIMLKKLLYFFFSIHDPTTLNQQGNDRGSQYRSAIFCLDEEQTQLAEVIKKEVEASQTYDEKGEVVTEIVLIKDKGETPFIKAEEDHQQYLAKNPAGYTCHFVRKVKFGEKEKENGDKKQPLEHYLRMGRTYGEVNDVKSIHTHYARPQLRKLFPQSLTTPANDKLHILDLGCGTGYFGQEAMHLWPLADVDFVDGSPELLLMAKETIQKNDDERALTKCRFFAQDMSKTFDRKFFLANHYDFIIAALSIHYVADWQILFAEVARLLRPGGYFLFSTHNPCLEFIYLKLNSYFTKELVEEEWKDVGKVSYYRHTFEEMWQAIKQNGFVLDEYREPPADEDLKKVDEKLYQLLKTHPHFIFVRLKKSSNQ